MADKEQFVRFEKVDKSYDGEVLVVKDLNLDVPKGEFLTMLGPSGSGKTTVLMMLAGFETPTSGEIYLDSNPISNIPPHKRGIGMVFQNYALFPHMTVYENLAFPLRVRKISKEDSDVIYLDSAKLNFPLKVRNLLSGDYFYPFGMNGKKKVSKYLKDKKISIYDKDKVLILETSKNKIIWVVGMRLDDRFSVTDNTKEITKIKLIR